MSENNKIIPVEIKGLMMDPTSNVPIVILRNDDLEKVLPIWIGIFEANAIALRLEEVESPRPMTHDLLRNLLDLLDAEILRVVITDLADNTFFAQIYISVAGEADSRILDARPSDAIALALRSEAPVFVEESVFDKATHDASSSYSEEEERIKKWLEEVDPDDLGKYTM
jgi:hypothetical protein